MFGPGDSLWVFEPSRRRLTVLTPSLELARTSPLPVPTAAAIGYNDGSMILQGSIPTRERIGLPLHKVSVDGQLRRSFGAVIPVVRPDNRFLESRRLTSSDEGQLWSARVSEYVLELWDTSGVHIQTLEVDTPWFKPWKPRSDGSRAGPMIIDIQQDPHGLVWVLISVADPNARVASDDRARAATGSQSEDRSWEFDSIVEVVDPKRGLVLASLRFDQHLRGFACPGIVHGYHEDKEGFPSIRIWSVAMSSLR
ncbi:MAG TPA: hypothetical protein VLE53_04885 [Gemmatimonadaceae bacterium]|nr:hypothetical protein [Gemmatimonadaceae bacterium]